MSLFRAEGERSNQVLKSIKHSSIHVPRCLYEYVQRHCQYLRNMHEESFHGGFRRIVGDYQAKIKGCFHVISQVQCTLLRR